MYSLSVYKLKFSKFYAILAFFFKKIKHKCNALLNIFHLFIQLAIYYAFIDVLEKSFRKAKQVQVYSGFVGKYNACIFIRWI